MNAASQTSDLRASNLEAKAKAKAEAAKAKANASAAKAKADVAAQKLVRGFRELDQANKLNAVLLCINQQLTLENSQLKRRRTG